MSLPEKHDILGLDLQELTRLAVENGQPSFRGKQLAEALYRQRISRLDQISTLPQSFRFGLAETGFQIGWPEILKRFVSRDGTIPYLIGFGGCESGETICMPGGDGGEAGGGTDACEEC